jgi:putative two-component system response regulator
MILSELLQPLYRVQAATTGEKALRIAQDSPRPDLSSCWM